MDQSDVVRLSVIVPVLNDAEGLRRCLQSFRRNGVPSSDTEVIVVDNGSMDGTVEVARQAGASTLVHPRLCVGALRNKGAEAARGRILAFVDADHEILGGWVEAACTLLSEDAAAAGAACLAPSPGTWVHRMYGRLRGSPSGRHDTEWLGGGNLLVRRDVFAKVGGFDTSLQACEDVDLCQRLRAAGWRLVSDARLRNVHHGDPGTIPSLFRSEMWRGRDNVRVSLRYPTWRGLPSVLVPVVDLACVGVVLIGAVITAGLPTLGWLGPWLALSGTLLIALLALARTVRMMRSPGSLGPAEWGRAFAVALVYDLARGLALVVRQPHRRAR